MVYATVYVSVVKILPTLPDKCVPVLARLRQMA